jgi:hypothetical protein
MSNNPESRLEVQLQASTGSPAAGTPAQGQSNTARAFHPTGGDVRKAPLLYLTFEGVLHAEHYAWGRARHRYLQGASDEKLFDNAALLCDVLRPYPAMRIVLSTSWISEFGFAVTLAQLPRRLQDVVIGCTDQAVSVFPGEQVAADVLNRRPEAWLAFDVDLFGWPEWCLPHLVVCDSDLGIARPDVLADLDAKLAEIGRDLA